MTGAINTQIIFQSRVGVVVPSVRGSWRALLRVYQILKLLQVQFLCFFSLLGFHQFSAFILKIIDSNLPEVADFGLQSFSPQKVFYNSLFILAVRSPTQLPEAIQSNFATL